MMTEEEAQQKWCPQSRSQQHDGANRKDGASGGIGVCIASQCMAWRWAVEPKTRDEWNDRYPNRSIRAEGFCGLSGRPSE
jgi:hypothetical protein